jgi:hypothetical protein
MYGWMDGWVGGCKSRFKDCLQQSKIAENVNILAKLFKCSIIWIVMEWRFAKLTFLTVPVHHSHNLKTIQIHLSPTFWSHCFRCCSKFQNLRRSCQHFSSLSKDKYRDLNFQSHCQSTLEDLAGKFLQQVLHEICFNFI